MTSSYRIHRQKVAKQHAERLTDRGDDVVQQLSNFLEHGFAKLDHNQRLAVIRLLEIYHENCADLVQLALPDPHPAPPAQPILDPDYAQSLGTDTFANPIELRSRN